MEIVVGKIATNKLVMMVTLAQVMDAALNAGFKMDGSVTQLIRKQNRCVQESEAKLTHVEMEYSKPI